MTPRTLIVTHLDPPEPVWHGSGRPPVTAAAGAPVRNRRYAMRLALCSVACRGLVAVAACIVAGGAAAQTRWVIVNGERLSDAQVARLARIQCTEIPDGAYWLNERSGAWGYAGNPQVQGHLGDLCHGAGSVNRDGTYGPFVTMGRANQEANVWRARGRNAVAFHNGDGYYVRVW